MKKEKWEEDFENYNENAETQKISTLAKKYYAKTITREEFDDLKKSVDKVNVMKKVKSQVKNIIDLKKQLDNAYDTVTKRISEIEKEITPEKVQKSEEENKKLEEELSKIQTKISSIDQKLNSKDLSDEDKNKLKEEKDKLKEQKSKNNEKFAKNSSVIQQGKANFDNKDLKNLKEEEKIIKKELDKCNLVGRSLMAGKSWNDIYLEYNKQGSKVKENTQNNNQEKKQNEKTNTQQQTTDNIKANKGKDNKQNSNNSNVKASSENEKLNEKLDENTQKLIEDVNRIMNGKEPKNNKETEIKKQSTWAQRHPKIAKFFRKIRSAFYKKDNQNDEKSESKSRKNQNTENKEKQSDKNKETIYKDPDLQRMEQIAMRGLAEVAQEVSQKRQAAKENEAKSAQEKLNNAKQEAFKRELQKYGEKYAERSARNNQNVGKEYANKKYATNKNENTEKTENGER